MGPGGTHPSEMTKWRGKLRLEPTSDLVASERLSSCRGNAAGQRITKTSPVPRVLFKNAYRRRYGTRWNSSLRDDKMEGQAPS
jgi:hypothetical protein